MPHNYYGTGHIIYQGSFYYHSFNSSNLILRYDLHLKRIVANITVDISKNDTDPKLCRVYSAHREHVGCFDFSVDENGLWLIYRNGSRHYIYVSKLNLEDLSIQKTVTIEFFSKRYQSWINRQSITSSFPKTVHKSENIKNETKLIPTPSHHLRDYDEILNGAIICGKIYFLQYHHSYNATIRFVFDLYNMEKFNYLQSIQFIQPFWKNTQLTYNPFDQKLYAWDSEYLLTYSLELINDEY